MFAHSKKESQCNNKLNYIANNKLITKEQKRKCGHLILYPVGKIAKKQLVPCCQNLIHSYRPLVR